MSKCANTSDYMDNCMAIFCDSRGNEQLVETLNDSDCQEDFVGMVQLLRLECLQKY